MIIIQDIKIIILKVYEGMFYFAMDWDFPINNVF